jgi:hypothetical protein
MAFSKEVLDEILKDYHGPEGIMKQWTLPRWVDSVKRLGPG